MATADNSSSDRSVLTRNKQNFHLVWLDENIDKNNDDCNNLITKLRQVVHTIHTFVDMNECINFIKVNSKEQTFVIVSEAFSRTVVPIITGFSCVCSIYIFCKNTVRLEQWAKQWLKIRGVHTDINSICNALTKGIQHSDYNSISIGIIKSTDGIIDKKLDTLDCSFMYTQLLKEILLTITFKQEHIDEFLAYCEEEFADNNAVLQTLDMIKNNYYNHEPIWWYTAPYFLHHTLNKALRTMDSTCIVKMGFFLQDLHNHIVRTHVDDINTQQNHSNSLTVYRGQGLSSTDFDRIKTARGGLLAFNNFVSTSDDRDVAYIYADSNQNNPDVVGVLFKITIDQSIPGAPFANIKDTGYFKEEKEILLCMHSVFRIGEVEELDETGRLWQVNLTLTSDNDPQLKALTECMQQETRGSTGWHRLGVLMLKIGQYDKAEELHNILLQQTTIPNDKAYLLTHMGIVKQGQGKYQEAVRLCEEGLKIQQQIHLTNDCNLAVYYNNIGSTYTNMGDYTKALEYYQEALKNIEQQTSQINPLDLAACYNNIGVTYMNTGNYSEACDCYQKAADILHKTLPENHPSQATVYNSMGLVYTKWSKFSEALEYYKKSLEILQKAVPENHPDLASSYHNIGVVYGIHAQYLKALEYYQKTLEIKQETLSKNHPDFAQCYSNIAVSYYEMHDYSKALEYNKKALDIWEKNFLGDHPCLAKFYNDIGMTYNDMGQHSDAIEYYQKTFDIMLKTLPENHPDFAQYYVSIATTFFHLKDYSKSVEYNKKAIELWQANSLTNHKIMAIAYCSLGAALVNIDKHSEALDCYKKASEIMHKTLPENHPDFAQLYNNMAVLYYDKHNSSKALRYFQRTLYIWQHSLPTNLDGIEKMQENIRTVRKELIYDWIIDISFFVYFVVVILWWVLR